MDVSASFEARRGATKDAFYQSTKRFIDQLYEESCKQWDQLQEGWDRMKEEQASMMYKYGDAKVTAEDLLELNVGGQPMDVQRGILTQLDDSRLAAVFSGRWDKRFPRDKKNRMFVDESPTVFRTVVEHLKRMKDGMVQGQPLIPEKADPNSIRDQDFKALQHFLDFWGLDKAMVPKYKACLPPGADKKEEQGLRKNNHNHSSSSSSNSSTGKSSNEMSEILATLQDAFYSHQLTLQKEQRAMANAQLAWKDEKDFVFHCLPVDPDDDIVYMSAIGYRLATRRSTLRSIEGSMLASLFNNERWTEQDEDLDHDGNYYLEVSPHSLGKVIDLLRQRCRYGVKRPCVDVLPGKRAEFEQVVQYFFPGLEGELMPDLELETVIVEEAGQIDALKKFMAHSHFELLYRGSRDGWGSYAFHQKCDHQGATMVLIKTTTGAIFGGYADKAWTSSSGSVCSSRSFLFSLTDGKDRQPCKLGLNGGPQNKNALYHHSIFGPTFGGGHDFQIASYCHTNCSSYSKLGVSYVLPRGADGDTFLAGSHKFTVAEMEVFRLVVSA